MIYFYCILHLHCQFVGHICKIFLQHVKVVASVFENFITIRSKTNGVYRLQSGVPFGVLSSVRSGVRSGVRCPLRKWPVTFFEDTGHRTLGEKSDLCQGGYSITLFWTRMKTAVTFILKIKNDFIFKRFKKNSQRVIIKKILKNFLHAILQIKFWKKKWGIWLLVEIGKKNSRFAEVREGIPSDIPSYFRFFIISTIVSFFSTFVWFNFQLYLPK